MAIGQKLGPAHAWWVHPGVAARYEDAKTLLQRLLTNNDAQVAQGESTLAQFEQAGRTVEADDLRRQLQRFKGVMSSIKELSNVD